MLKIEMGKYYCFEMTYLHFLCGFMVNIAFEASCYCLWYYIANTCLYNKSYHYAKETMETMLTNGQTDGHRRSRVLLLF